MNMSIMWCVCVNAQSTVIILLLSKGSLEHRSSGHEGHQMT